MEKQKLYDLIIGKIKEDPECLPLSAVEEIVELFGVYCCSCDSKGYLEVTCEDNQEYIQACDTCNHFGIIGDTDSLAREVAENDGYVLNSDGKILEQEIKF